MPPLAASSDIWTPDVIATVVYRVIMIIVSLAFIWKAYRQPVRQLDDEHVFDTVLPRTPSHISRSSSRSVSHALIAAQLESMVQSTLGIEDDEQVVPPLVPRRNDNNSTPIACTNRELEAECPTLRSPKEHCWTIMVDTRDSIGGGRRSAGA